MPTLPIHNTQGQAAGTMDLPESVFSPRINQDIIHQAVVMYQASRRQGTASTKERGMVSGGGKKPYR